MSSPLITIEKDGPFISVITLNRPEKRNALTIGLMQELCAAVDVASKDESRRILIIKGAGEVFCAGLDLKEASEPGRGRSSAKMVARMLLAVSQTPLITIAAVHGAAVGGGAGLMSVCDLVVAADDTKIGYPEVRRGLTAAMVTTFLLHQLKERDARELLLTGELISAECACRMGLVNRMVPSQDLMKEVHELAGSILQGSPEALRQTKRLLGKLNFPSLKKDLAQALRYHLKARHSEDAQEGMSAFFEKRPPRWVQKSDRCLI